MDVLRGTYRPFGGILASRARLKRARYVLEYNKLCVVARFRPKSDAVEYQVKHSDERPIEAGQSAPEMMSQTRFTTGMLRTNSPLPAVEGHAQITPNARGNTCFKHRCPTYPHMTGRWSLTASLASPIWKQLLQSLLNRLSSVPALARYSQRGGFVIPMDNL